MNINVELALKVNKFIHEECIDGTPHDIGWNVMKLLNDSQPKMVEVGEKHKLMDFLAYCKKGEEVGLTIETSLHDALLNFLNQE